MGTHDTAQGMPGIVPQMANDALERLYMYHSKAYSRAWMERRLSDFHSLQSFITAAEAQAAELAALRVASQGYRDTLNQIIDLCATTHIDGKKTAHEVLVAIHRRAYEALGK